MKEIVSVIKVNSRNYTLDFHNYMEQSDLQILSANCHFET